MSENEITYIVLLLLLILKHVICDGPLQTAWQALNKGIYGHPGGLAHAGLHACGTFIAFMIVTNSVEDGPIIVMAAALDLVLHYHIDWAKERASKVLGLATNESTPDGLRIVVTDSRWFQALVIDQALHMTGYVLLAAPVLLRGSPC